MTIPEQHAFKNITIIGLGLIGGSLAQAFRHVGFKGKIQAVSSEATLKTALDQKIIDAGFPYGDLLKPVSQSDLIILASPIQNIMEHIRELGQSTGTLQAGTVVTDVGSTKRVILEEAERVLPKEIYFIGGHPMAGSEKRGLLAADPFLFQNAYYVLTPSHQVPGKIVKILEGFLSSIGARVIVLEAREHDRTAAVISHIPQLLAIALVNFLKDNADNRDHAVRLAAGGFRDMTRIASSPFSMWKDIFQTNASEVQEFLKCFIQVLESTSVQVGSEELEKTFDKAALTRAEIPRDSKGFLNPLCEVLVVVEDRPGMIATIANTLSDHQINIKDIEVLKVREDEGGTMRLAFSTLDIAQKAIGLLSAEGLTARLRE